jgi:hypothetical protein
MSSYTLCDLPKDIIWVIMKHYMNDLLVAMYNDSDLYSDGRFLAKRNMKLDSTFHESISSRIILASANFICFLYPLRLICRACDDVMKKKIIKRYYGDCDDFIESTGNLVRITINR